MTTPTIYIEYVAELYVRPRQGGAPVSRGLVVVRHEPSVNQAKLLRTAS